MYSEDAFIEVPSHLSADTLAGPTYNKVDNLDRARNKKLNLLSERTGYGKQDRTDSSTVLAGANEHMGNKVLNEYSPYELEFLGEELNKKYGLVQTEQGLMQRSDDGGLVPFEGDTNDYASYYEYATKDGNIKKGTWGGFDPSERYSDSYLEAMSRRNNKPQFVGELGVDVNQLKRQYILPRNIAATYEALIHGSVPNLENRAVRYTEGSDLAAYQALRDKYGSGATEVYRQSQLSAPENFDGAALVQAATERFKFDSVNSTTEPSLEEIAQMYRDEFSTELAEPQTSGFINRAANVASGALSNLLRTFALDSGAAIGELVGLDVTSTAESRRAYADNLFGYDSSHAQEGMEKIGKRIEAIMEAEQIDLDDVFAIIGAELTTPELIGESIGALVGMVVGLGKLTKVGKGISQIEKAYKAGKYTKDGAKAAVKDLKKTQSVFNNVLHTVGKNVGYGAVVAGMTNNAVEEFKKNNGGEASVGDVLRIGAFQALIAGMDKVSGSFIMDAMPGIRKVGIFAPEARTAMKKVVQEMPANVYSRTADSVLKVLKGTAKVGGDILLEGSTEYAQTMGELFSVQYATEKYGDDFGKLFADKANQIEAWTGAAVGAGMGGQMNVANTVVGSTGKLTSVAASSLAGLVPKPSETPAGVETDPQAPASEDVVSPEEYAADRATYTTLMSKVADAYNAGTITEKNVGNAVAVLEELQRTRYTVLDSDPANLAKADAALKLVEDHVYALVKKSTTGDIDTSNTVLGSRPDIDVGKNSDKTTVDEVFKDLLPNVTVARNPDMEDGNTVWQYNIDEDTFGYVYEEGNTVYVDMGEVKKGQGAKEIRDAVSTYAHNTNKVVVEDPEGTADLAESRVLVSMLRSAVKHGTTKHLSPTKALLSGTDSIPAVAWKAGNDEANIKAMSGALRQIAVREYPEIADYTYDEKTKTVSDAQGKTVTSAQLKKLVDGRITKAENPTTLGLSSVLAVIKDAPNKKPTALSVAKQKASAEKTIEIVASRDGVAITPETKAKLHKIGERNGVSKARVERIIKSYASVELEATVEDRGVVARERSLDLLLASGTATNAQVQRSYNEAVKFYTTTMNSIDALEQGVADAQNKAQEATARKSKKSFTVVTGYKKSTDKTGQANYFDITVSFDGKTSVAHVTPALTLIKHKKRTAVALKALVDKFQQEARAYLKEDSLLDTGGYTVSSNGNSVTGVKEEAKFVADVVNTLKDLPNFGSTINRIIVGSKESARWAAGTERARVNDLRTNIKQRNEDYTPTDVVYLHAPHTFTPKKSKSKMELSELHNPDSTARKEVDAAMSVGAAIVIDNEHKSLTNPVHVAVSAFMFSNNYMRFLPAGVGASIFVPVTEENTARYETAKSAMESEKKAKKDKEDRTSKLTGLAVERAASSIEGYKGRDLASIEADIAKAKVASRQDFVKLATSQVSKAADEQTTVTEEDINQKIDENIEAFMTNSVNKSVAETLLDVDRAGIDIFDVEDTDSPALLSVAQQRAREILAEDADKLKVLTAWTAAAGLKLRGKALITKINTLLKEQGVDTTISKEGLQEKGQAQTIMETAAGTQITTPTYHYHVQHRDGTNHKVEWYSAPVLATRAKEDAAKIGSTDDIVLGGKKFGLLGIREIVHNPNAYATVSQTTALNTLPVTMLPQAMVRLSDRVQTALSKVLSPFSAGELTLNERGFFDSLATVDSPARALIFAEDGTIHPNMLVAMAAAVGDLIKTDSYKLTLGNKDAKTLAAMFKVQESEVTDAMKGMAAENGSFAKTIAHTLGTSTLSALGISKLRETQVNRGQYERLVIDLGNTVLAAAIEDGSLAMTSVKSNDLAKLYRDGEVDTSEAITWFVHAPTQRKKNKADKTKLNKSAEMFAEDFTLAEEALPDMVNAVTQPKFGEKLTAAEKALRLDRVRNDIVGGSVPAEAKKTLEALMDTPYEMDMDNVKEFVEAISTDAKKQQVMKHLGWIEISDTNPDYVNLPFSAKEIQEAINRDVEKSVAAIEEYYQAIESGSSNQMYFPFFYTGNHRYMMESNTLNGQADKLHRFFVTPSAHRTTYTFDREAHTFKHEYMLNGETKTVDTSLYVRAALAQAFGVGIDKTSTNRIIQLGNYVLSMSEADLIQAKQDLFTNGKFQLTTAEGVVEFAPDHFSHGLQGLNFLLKYQTSATNQLTDSLTAEFDALTSGFSNKVQQFGLISNVHEHLQRVGILGDDSSVNTQNSPLFSINDMLSNKEFTDSYKNMAKDSIERAGIHLDTLKADGSATARRSARMFTGIQNLLPGGKLLGVDKASMDIDKTLRNLFKPGFMIFNYSAGVNRITSNLSTELVESIFAALAKADLKNLDQAQKEAFTVLSAEMGLTFAELQDRIRTESTTKIMLPKAALRKGESSTTSQSLFSYLADNVLKPTYGEAVKDVFEENFKEFIDIQNKTNDAFKLSFNVFGELLQQKAREYKASSITAPITEELVFEWIQELRDAFPVIAGPLSQELGDGVFVYDKDTRSIKGSLATVPSPKIHLVPGKDAGTKTRLMHPLIKSIVAAMNSGAVLPFHAIDGAQMSRLVNEITESFMAQSANPEHGSGILPIHDAVMGPLWMSDMVAWTYNKNTSKLNEEYSIISEMAKLVARVNSIVDGAHPTLKVETKNLAAVKTASTYDSKEANKLVAERKRLTKSLSDTTDETRTAGLLKRLAEVDKELIPYSFIGQLQETSTSMKVLEQAIEVARSSLFSDDTKFGVLVGLPGSMYTRNSETNTTFADGTTDAEKTVQLSTGYLDDLDITGRYKNEAVSIGKTVSEPAEAVESVQVDEVVDEVSIEEAISQAMQVAGQVSKINGLLKKLNKKKDEGCTP